MKLNASGNIRLSSPNNEILRVPHISHFNILVPLSLCPGLRHSLRGDNTLLIPLSPQPLIPVV